MVGRLVDLVVVMAANTVAAEVASPKTMAANSVVRAAASAAGVAGQLPSRVRADMTTTDRTHRPWSQPSSSRVCRRYFDRSRGHQLSASTRACHLVGLACSGSTSNLLRCISVRVPAGNTPLVKLYCPRLHSQGCSARRGDSHRTRRTQHQLWQRMRGAPAKRCLGAPLIASSLSFVANAEQAPPFAGALRARSDPWA